LSVGFVLLSTLPVSHEPGFGIVEHWFKILCFSDSHVDDVGDHFLDEALQCITEAFPFKFNIIWIDIDIEF
jgi:hypothetical protein